MTNIGTFTKSGDGYKGEIATISLQLKNIRIVRETETVNDNAPSHRVFVDRTEIGAAWSKQSQEGRDYLSVKLDDPGLANPIYASLFAEDGADTFALIWTRARRINGD